MDGGQWSDPSSRRTTPIADGAMPPLRRFKFAAPGLFSTLGIPLVAGRDYTWDEIYQKPPVAIVSANFAREYWGSPANASASTSASAARTTGAKSSASPATCTTTA